jgi:hypothetical protein
MEFLDHYTDQEKYFEDSDRTMLGLARYTHFPKLLDYFKKHNSAVEVLSDDELKSLGFIYTNNKGKTINRSQEQRKKIDQSKLVWQQMVANQQIVESLWFGKIAIAFPNEQGKNELPCGVDAAYFYGCSVYISWSDTGFFISSQKPFPEEFVLSEGEKIRGTMYLRPQGEPLTMSLQEVLDKLGVGFTDTVMNAWEARKAQIPEIVPGPVVDNQIEVSQPAATIPTKSAEVPQSPQAIRSQLEKIKAQEGKIAGGEFSDVAYTAEYLQADLNNLVEDLLTTEVNQNLNYHLHQIAAKTNLSEQEIRDIYRTQEDLLIAEAQARLTKNPSCLAKTGWLVGKSAAYIGLGTLAAASSIASLGATGLWKHDGSQWRSDD